MKRKILIGSVIVVNIVVLLAVMLLGHCTNHDWEIKSCTEPPVCKKCGEVAEQAWHSWTLMGGCMEPLGCSVCGIEGDVPGHIWSDVEPKACVICGQTEAEVLATPAPTEVPAPSAPTEEPKPTEVPVTPETTEVPVVDNGENETGDGDKVPVVGTDLNDLEANEQVIIDTIIRDIAVYNQFIYEHLGYSEEEWGPGPHSLEADPTLDVVCLKSGVMDYMDYLIKYAAGEEVIGAFLRDAERNQPIESQIEEVRACIFTQTPYNQTHPDDFQNYTMILKNFLEDGHPDITSIDRISLEWADEFMMFDTRSCDVIATFTSNGETFKCYLSGTSSSAEGAYYTVLDLDRIE